MFRYAERQHYLVSVLVPFSNLGPSSVRLVKSKIDSEVGFPGRQIFDQTVRNRLHMASLHTYKAARKPAMTALHSQARLRWCRQHRQWNLRMWGNVMFSDESRFCLQKLDGRIKVWRCRGEHHADCCTDHMTSFSGAV